VSEYKFNNGFIYRKDFKLPMTRVVEILNEMHDQLNKGSEKYKDLFEAFEDGQKVLKDVNARLENLSRVNKEYKEVLTPIWDYCKANVKVELGKSITEALIESHKELVTKVEVLEQERDEDLMKLQGLGFECHNLKEKLAKANERVKALERDAKNNELVHVGFTNGDQVNYAKVEEGSFYPDTSGDCYIPLYMLKSHEHRIETTSIEQLRKEQANEKAKS